MPMPINQVPIFSDSVFNRYQYYRYRMKQNQQRVKILYRANSQKSSNLDLYLSAFVKGLKSSVALRYWQKLYRAMFMSTKAKREWLSFQCTNRLGKTKCLSPILYLVFLKCILFQKKLATNAFIEEFLWKTTPDNMKNFCIVHLSAKDSILNAFTTFESKTCDWRILAGGILKSFSQENRGQNTVRSGIHDIACTGANLTG